MGFALLREDRFPSGDGPGLVPPRRRRRHWFRWIAASLLIVVLAVTLGVVIAARHAEPFLRELIVERLSDRFHSKVELDSFHISVANGLWAQGKGLRIWPPAQVEGMEVTAVNARPLIELAQFRFHAPLHYARGKPVRIDRVELSGLKIDVPPRPHFTHRPEPPAAPVGPPGAELIQFKVGSVICNNAQLTLETTKPEKLPLVFDIQTIKLTNITDNGKMDFDAKLLNPRPKGFVSAQGSLGPWPTDDPGRTPVTGSYHLDHADLSVFPGIAGMLDSAGTYSGTLREMTVDGQADTPDFALTHFGSSEALHTTFHARVDGTDGDTWLEPVNATLGHSRFTARGKIVQVVDEESDDGNRHSVGHEIVLDVHISGGQMADFLRLTSRTGDPLLTGKLDLRTTFELPPGQAPIHERVRLKGRFLLDGAQFTSPKLQDRVADLSLRGQGKPKDTKDNNPSEVRSTMSSDFTIAAGKVNLPDLVYLIPGAEIDLHGNYGIEGGSLDFQGKARMQATVSKMVGGWKGALLRPVDRFFKKDGAGTKIGIHVQGTRDNPQFGVNL